MPKRAAKYNSRVSFTVVKEKSIERHCNHFGKLLCKNYSLKMALENIVLFKCQRSMHIKNRLYNFRIIEFEILRILATLWLIDPSLKL